MPTMTTMPGESMPTPSDDLRPVREGEAGSGEAGSQQSAYGMPCMYACHEGGAGKGDIQGK